MDKGLALAVALSAGTGPALAQEVKRELLTDQPLTEQIYDLPEFDEFKDKVNRVMGDCPYTISGGHTTKDFVAYAWPYLDEYCMGTRNPQVTKDQMQVILQSLEQSYTEAINAVRNHLLELNFVRPDQCIGIQVLDGAIDTFSVRPCLVPGVPPKPPTDLKGDDDGIIES